VIDDHVGHDVHLRRERRDVVPRAEPRVDLRVVDRVEPGVGLVDRVEERQDVHAAERALQGALEQGLQTGERPAGEPVDVGDELRPVLHRRQPSRVDQPGPRAGKIQSNRLDWRGPGLT
jgi:hypothetical protein